MAKKVKFEVEFIIKSSPKLLYNYLSTPSGLSNWFAENVNLRDDIYTFMWDDTEEQAKLVAKKDNQFIKFKWLDEEVDDTFFEFKIEIDDLTKDVALMITDFAAAEDIESSKQLWERQIDELHGVLGV